MAPIPLLNPIKKLAKSLRQIATRLVAMAEKPRQSPQVTHNVLPSVAGFFLLAGMLLFLSIKLLPSDPLFRGAYYLWDKTKDCLLFYCLLLLCPSIRRFLLVVFIYSLIRLLWQIYITVTSEDINDIRWIVATWSILVAYFSFLSIREIIRDIKNLKDKC